MVARTADSAYVCGWDSDLCCSTLEDLFIADDEDKNALAQRCLNSAAEILYALSGRQFGRCELTVRPCYQKCAGYSGITDWNNGVLGAAGLPWLPVLSGGSWTNISCGCRTACSCTVVCEVWLPGPIDSIVEIKQDGVVLDSGVYRVDNRRALVRNDGLCWPKCQNMSAADTEEGTWSVTYLRGKPVPEAGRAALSDLACEISKACLGDTSCKLPSRVTSIQRQGISMAMLDPMTFIDYGRTGLYSVDLWLKTVNPHARTRGAAVLSPDVEAPRRTTWPSLP